MGTVAVWVEIPNRAWKDGHRRGAPFEAKDKLVHIAIEILGFNPMMLPLSQAFRLLNTR
jgi:hypothetical protein